LFPVILKQRPQASPKLLLAPNARWFIATVNPEEIFPPHAEEGSRAQHRVKPQKKIGAELTG
jgi:hypothetical protein